MELYLHHGRRTPGEELEDHGLQGPRLQGVKGCHQTYDSPVNVHFVDAAACREAKLFTGWENWDECSLILRWHEDMVHVKRPDGGEVFYGDWGII